MKSCLLALKLSFALFAHCVAAAELMPNDFAFGMSLELASDAVVFKLATPTEVYQQTVRSDLGDLRIFNGDGEWVPYALSAPVTQASTRETPVPVPMFPLRGDPARALENFRVTIAAGKGTVNLQTTSPGAQASAVQAYFIDTRLLEQPVTALELHWPDNAPEFSGSINVESSDDLRQWRTLINQAPIVNLRFGAQQLVQNRIEFTPVKVRFLRVLWQERSVAVVLTEILAEPAPLLAVPKRIKLDVSGVAVTDQADTYEFDLNAHAPVDRINVKLPQMNSFASVSLASRDQLQSPWQDIATLSLYELQNNGQLVRNPDFTVTRNTQRYWRIRAQPGAMGRGIPTLQAAWVPHEITFVARGRPPFKLAFGNATTRPATSLLQSLTNMPATDIRIGTATVGSLHELGGVARLQVQSKLPWKTWLLWSALIVAVGILALVAYRLSRDLSK